MDPSLSSHTNQPSVPISSLLLDSSSQMDPITHAEQQVETALDDLVATGALQRTNRMDIESLLNPAGESHVLTETSDAEIYQAVVKAIEAHENIDGDDIDDDITLEPYPTQHDVLKAVSTIARYVGDWNDLIACKIEALLGSFNRQLRYDETRNMKNTVLTDFFQRTY